MPCHGGVGQLLVAPYGLGTPTPRSWRKATCLWHDARGWRSPDSRQLWRPSKCVRDRSAPRACAPHPPRAMLTVWAASGPGSEAPHEGAQITLTSGQDHCEAVVGLLHLEAVARSRFPGDSPMEVTGRCAGGILPTAPRPAAPSFTCTRFLVPICAPRSQATRSVSGPARATGC